MRLTCCARPEPAWTISKGADQIADKLICMNCGQVHLAESYLVPVIFPTRDRCMNCSGSLEPDTLIEGDPVPTGFQCERCELHDKEARELHQKLAEKVTPGASIQEAALAALEQGRTVLALKLATAWCRDEPDNVEARTIRLQALQTIGYGESAAREAWRWSKDDNPPLEIWTILAELEGANGNLEGAIRALQRGLRQTPDDLHMWADYAELLLAVDQRPSALDATNRLIDEETLRPRALAVVAEVAQRALADENDEQLAKALARAGDFADTYAPLVYIRAQHAALKEDAEAAVRLLERTVKLDPDNAEAQAALDRIRPPPKKRWFW